MTKLLHYRLFSFTVWAPGGGVVPEPELELGTPTPRWRRRNCAKQTSGAVVQGRAKAPRTTKVRRPNTERPHDTSASKTTKKGKVNKDRVPDAGRGDLPKTHVATTGEAGQKLWAEAVKPAGFGGWQLRVMGPNNSVWNVEQRLHKQTKINV